MFRELIKKQDLYNPTFDGGLYNHLSLALMALRLMNVTEKGMRDFVEYYSKHLDRLTLKNVRKLSDENWDNEIGHLEAYLDFKEFFRKEVRDNGVRRTLSKYLPFLIKGMVEVHGLIHTAYAFETNDHNELANGLATMASMYSATASRSFNPNGNKDSGEILTQLAEIFNNYPDEKGLINKRILSLTTNDAFLACVHNLRIDEETVLKLASLAIGMYIAKPNFSTLHTATTVHAYRVLEEFLSNESVGYVFQAIASVFVSEKAPYPFKMLTSQTDEWNRDWFIKAAATKEEHVIKMTYTCSEEFAAYGDLRYLMVADALAKNGSIDISFN